jgi:hypothetical protein
MYLNLGKRRASTHPSRNASVHTCELVDGYAVYAGRRQAAILLPKVNQASILLNRWG